MAMVRRNFDREFREGAVRIVRETGRPIAQVARDLGLHEGTLGRWLNLDRRARDGEGPLSESERDELNRLRKENAELAMERDVLKRSAALWVLSRTRDNSHYVECRIMPSVVLDCLRGKRSAHPASALSNLFVTRLLFNDNVWRGVDDEQGDACTGEWAVGPVRGRLWNGVGRAGIRAELRGRPAAADGAPEPVVGRAWVGRAGLDAR